MRVKANRAGRVLVSVEEVEAVSVSGLGWQVAGKVGELGG